MKFSILAAMTLAAFTFSAYGQLQYRNVSDVRQSSESDSRPRIVAGASSDDPVEVKPATFTAKAAAVNIGSLEHSAFDQINQKRVENGLAPLVWSDAVAGIARIHSQHMAELSFFAHRDLEGKLVSDRADDAGLTKWRAIGENIAFNRGFSDPVGRTVELWLNSQSHRQNLMSENWKESAIGVAVGKDGSLYFTQVFLQRK